eukprot:1009502-Prorocentrum_minimum.AAC.1
MFGHFPLHNPPFLPADVPLCLRDRTRSEGNLTPSACGIAPALRVISSLCPRDHTPSEGDLTPSARG